MKYTEHLITSIPGRQKKNRFNLLFSYSLFPHYFQYYNRLQYCLQWFIYMLFNYNKLYFDCIYI